MNKTELENLMNKYMPQIRKSVIKVYGWQIYKYED